VKVGLLDVNVLIALLDPDHEFHHAAHGWFEHNRRHGWATCPITENGCLRILSKPGYPQSGLALDQVRDILAEFVDSEDHRFWPDSVSMLEANRFQLAGAGPKNLTDIYLLRLATACGGRLITFDQGIRPDCIAGSGLDNLEVLPGRRFT
jgi:toxin-antitoxin system PIN domain toxin